MKRTSFYHITWIFALIATILLAIIYPSYWYIPLVAYFIIAIASIVIIAIKQGKVSQLPKYVKMSVKKTINK